jgi:hypothetical protein
VESSSSGSKLDGISGNNFKCIAALENGSGQENGEKEFKGRVF